MLAFECPARLWIVFTGVPLSNRNEIDVCRRSWKCMLGRPFFLSMFLNSTNIFLPDIGFPRVLGKIRSFSTQLSPITLLWISSWPRWVANLFKHLTYSFFEITENCFHYYGLYTGRSKEVLSKRVEIKKQTLQARRVQNLQTQAVQG